MFCPACNGRLIYAGSVPVLFPRLRFQRISDVLTCTRCTATTEVDKAAGRLIDYTGVTLAQVFRPYPSLRCRQTSVSLRGGNPIVNGES